MTDTVPPPYRPDPRFFLTAPAMSVMDAARLAGATLPQNADGGAPVTHVAPLARAGPGAATFVESAKALADIGVRSPGLILTTDKLVAAVEAAFPNSTIGVTAAPKAGFAALGQALHKSRLDVPVDGARIAPDADISPTAQIAASAVVMAGARIADGVRVGEGAVIGPGVEIGAGTVIGAHVCISHAVIGRDCVFSAGVRIGEAGFGYVPGPSGAMPVPQLGRVLIGDRVDVGANSTVDRGAMEDTIIGEGTKIDNLVQIAHNCCLGRHVLIAAQTGVSGSCIIGDGVMIGGQVGMADHLTIGAGAVIAAKAGLMRDVPAGEKWGGAPAKPAREWMKDVATLSRLSKKENK